MKRSNETHVSTAIVAKSGSYNYYCCQTYIRQGRDACNAALLNKDKFEQSVLDQVQEHILTEENVRQYINLVIEPAQESKPEPSADETAVKLAIRNAEAKVRRWEEALEKGLLSLEDCAGRIKELRQEARSPSPTKGRFAEKIPVRGQNPADTDSANGRICPTDADAATREKNRL